MKLFLIYQSGVIGATPNIKYEGQRCDRWVARGTLPRSLFGEFERPESSGPALVFRFRS